MDIVATVGNHAAAASVVLVRQGAVLMVLRARAPFAGLWSFPGGRTRPDETAEQTARRELLEETSLTTGALTRIGAFQPAPELSPLLLTVFASSDASGDLRAGDDALRVEFVAVGAVLKRRCTAGAAGWIARALIALARPPLLP